MRYPQLLNKGDTIGICAPSSGASGEKLSLRLDKAIRSINALGYDVVETASVRSDEKCVSADSQTRAAEFMELYENPGVKLILPPWGGDFLMDMLPYLDFDALASLSPKWVCGYSDISTLTFALTLNSDMATVHGSNSLNMGYARIHDTDLRLFDVVSSGSSIQESWEAWGGFIRWEDSAVDVYTLDNPSAWKSLNGETSISFSGMMIGGCMDTLCKLLGTRFAPVDTFLNKYKEYGFIWALESAEMASPDIYRTLWQMRESGWFKYCNGIIFGRPDGYQDKGDFALVDALQQGLGRLNLPVLYDTDIGHIPPQMQIVNGAIGTVDYTDGKATVRQRHL